MEDDPLTGDLELTPDAPSNILVTRQLDDKSAINGLFTSAAENLVHNAKPVPEANQAVVLISDGSNVGVDFVGEEVVTTPAVAKQASHRGQCLKSNR